ncbi:MAG: rod shape-determining protein MreC [Muribaculaceae bacterium]|nr:rod shape-determining protein MreC [Muribaculaceae bacterium]
MRELFRFLVRNSKWFVFVFFATISCVLLFNSSPYHHHLYLTSAGAMASSVYKTSGNVTSYFNLRDINDDLNRRNAELQAEIGRLRQTLTEYREVNYTDTLVPDSGMAPFRYIVAHVINNSISRPYNYITLDRGTADGIRPELGVIDGNGVVGIVSNVGAGSARVISLLNPNFRLSCKLRSTDYFGSLVWDGKSPDEALLEELPRHTVFEIGDTVVTSGFSAVFPAGIPVGVITASEGDRTQNFFTLRVRLFADFSTLGNVQVIINNQADELRALTAGEENDAKRNPFGQ